MKSMTTNNHCHTQGAGFHLRVSKSQNLKVSSKRKKFDCGDALCTGNLATLDHRHTQGAHFCVRVNKSQNLKVCSKCKKFDCGDVLRAVNLATTNHCHTQGAHELKNTMTALQHGTVTAQLFKCRRSSTKDNV